MTLCMKQQKDSSWDICCHLSWNHHISSEVTISMLLFLLLCERELLPDVSHCLVRLLYLSPKIAPDYIHVSDWVEDTEDMLISTEHKRNDQYVECQT